MSDPAGDKEMNAMADATGPQGFYVSVEDHGRRGLLLGPYATKGEADGKAGLGRRLAGQVSDRAVWYAYGVTRVVMRPGTELPADKLNHLAALPVLDPASLTPAQAAGLQCAAPGCRKCSPPPARPAGRTPDGRIVKACPECAAAPGAGA